jgi:prepilin-type N-terminal cleavage/methylation domain-containing protein
MNTNKNQDKGFTLVELLIVIVILGILATVTVFAVRGITDTGQQNACDTESKTVLTAAEAYYAQNSGSTETSVTALYTAGYLADDGASANWTLAANSGAGQVVTITAITTGDCA